MFILNSQLDERLRNYRETNVDLRLRSCAEAVQLPYAFLEYTVMFVEYSSDSPTKAPNTGNCCLCVVTVSIK